MHVLVKIKHHIFFSVKASTCPGKIYFSSYGAPRARPNPSISRVLEGFSRENHAIPRVLAPPGRAPTPPFLVFWRGFRVKKHAISQVLAPPGPPRKRGLGNQGPFSPGPFLRYIISIHLYLRKGNTNPRQPDTRSDQIASPARGGGGLPLPAAASAAP